MALAFGTRVIGSGEDCGKLSSKGASSSELLPSVIAGPLFLNLPLQSKAKESDLF